MSPRPRTTPSMLACGLMIAVAIGLTSCGGDETVDTTESDPSGSTSSGPSTKDIWGTEHIKQAKRQMNMLLVACVEYSTDHRDRFPPNLELLKEVYAGDITDEVYELPAANNLPQPHFLYVRPAVNRGGLQPILLSNPAWQATGGGLIVSFGDGSIREIRDPQLAQAAWTKGQELAALPHAQEHGIRMDDWGNLIDDLNNQQRNSQATVAPASEALQVKRNMGTISIALLEYAHSMTGSYPQELEALMEYYPDDITQFHYELPGGQNLSKPHLLYVRPVSSARATQPVILSNPAWPTTKGNLLICFADGYVATTADPDLAQELWAKGQELAASPKAAERGVGHDDWGDLIERIPSARWR